MANEIVPITRVFKIIDSCRNLKQLNTCKKLAEVYTDLVKSKGVVNYNKVKEILFIRINEKREELGLVNKFNGKIKRRKIKIREIEKELAENFT